MARSSLVALCVLLAACSTSVVPPVTPPGSSSSRTPRTFEPTPFNEGVLHYADTVRAFVTAFDAGRYDDAIALVDERFLFGGDCDYDAARLYRLDDRESVTYWLRSRMADHDRIDIVRFVDLQDGGSTIGLEIVRTSDTIRSRGYSGGSVRPRVPVFVRLTLDGLRIRQLAYVWSTPTATFSDCLP